MFFTREGRIMQNRLSLVHNCALSINVKEYNFLRLKICFVSTHPPPHKKEKIRFTQSIICTVLHKRFTIEWHFRKIRFQWIEERYLWSLKIIFPIIGIMFMHKRLTKEFAQCGAWAATWTQIGFSFCYRRHLYFKRFNNHTFDCHSVSISVDSPLSVDIFMDKIDDEIFKNPQKMRVH